MTTPHTTQPIKLYRHPLSGHGHRVELMLNLLQVPHTLVEVNLAAGEHKQAAFLAMNAFGQLPVIEDNGVILADSNAILVYLANRYGAGTWLPADPVAAARVQRWLSVAANQLANGPAAARLVTVFGAKLDAELLIARSHALLQVIESELTGQPYLTGHTVTIADIACYTYLAHAPEGNVSLAQVPHIHAWLARIEQLPGFVPMQKSAVGLAG